MSRKIAKEILYDNMSDNTAKHINNISFLEDWIIDAMVEYRKKQVKNNDLLHSFSQRTYFFDCWNVGGKTFTKEIKATCKEHAILKFEKEYDSFGYDDPYVG